MIESEDHRKYLLNIARRLKYEWHSVPTDESGDPTETYLEYLSLLYSQDIAKLVQELEIFPKMMSIVKFAKKVNMDKNELTERLKEVAHKGFVVNLGKQYSLPSPLIIWDTPFIYSRTYESNIAKRLAELGLKFFYKEGYYQKWETTIDGIPRNRILTVSEEIEPKDQIVPIEEVYNIIDQNTDIAVIPCPCRNRQEISGHRECKDKYPIHTCLILGIFAKGALEQADPAVKKVSREEAKEIAKKASEIGLVHTTDNVGNNCRLICSCCECCCVIIGGLTRLDNPRAVARANYVANVDEEICEACSTCVERCKFNAITIEDTAKIDIERCLGCGLCAVKCPHDAIIMKRFVREEIPLEREEIEILD